jgi:bifunctional DNase/RNase
MRRACAGVAMVMAFALATLLPRVASLARPNANPTLVEMELLRVGSLDDQVVVLLRSKAERKILPIWIGEAEANAISARMMGRRLPRPLTHDLLDRVMAQLGGRLLRVQIEDLRETVFFGRIFIRQGQREIDIDARPSDSIALAVGAQVPILVARKVLDAAGVEDKPSPRGDKSL